MFWTSLAFAATYAVPGDYATLAEVAEVAQHGDLIQLGQGEHAGAHFDVEVEIIGQDAVVSSTLSTTSALWVEGVDFRSGSPCLSVVGGSLLLVDSTVEGCEHQEGGGLYAKSSVIELAEVRFEGNEATRGGAISVDDSALRIETSVLSGNRAVYGSAGAIFAHGSEVFLLDVEVTGNEAYNSGGALLQSGGELSIEGSLFQGNSSVYGVATTAFTGGSATLVDTRFVGEHGYNGGAVSLDLDGGEAWVQGCEFEDGRTTYGTGGALHIADASLAVVHLSRFEGNRAYNGGGALRVDAVDELLLEQLVFEDNATTYGKGGAIHVNASVVQLVEVELSEGSSHDGGGLLYLHAGEAALSQVLLAHGRSTYGGGGLAELAASSLFVERSVFQDGQAQGAGGLLASCQQGRMLNNDFVGNAGAGAELRCELELLNNLFASNSASSVLPESADYSLFFQDATPSTGAGDLSADPLFLSWPEDLHLEPSSPAVDAGHPDTLDPDGTVADIGAYWVDQAEPEDTGDSGWTDDSGLDDSADPSDDSAIDSAIDDSDVHLKGGCGCGVGGPMAGLLLLPLLLLPLLLRRR